MAWTTLYEDTEKRIDRDDTGVERITYANPNREALQQAAVRALAANRTFISRGTANTAAQVRDQTLALSRQTNALIRLALNMLDGTD